MPNLLPARGKPTGPIVFEVLRELTSADLFRLGTTGGQRVGVPSIQRVREIHRRQARLIARGLTLRDVAARCDTTPQRLTQLMNDPSFTNLIAYYRVQTEDVVLDASARMQEQLVDVAELAVAEIQDRLEDPTERAKLPFGELRKAAELGLDRTIAPVKNVQPGMAAPVAITFNIPGRGLRDMTSEPPPVIDNVPAKPPEDKP